MSTEIIAVNRVVEAFAEAWNKHDMNAFSELFAEDAEFVNVVGFSTVDGNVRISNGTVIVSDVLVGPAF